MIAKDDLTELVDRQITPSGTKYEKGTLVRVLAVRDHSAMVTTSLRSQARHTTTFITPVGNLKKFVGVCR